MITTTGHQGTDGECARGVESCIASVGGATGARRFERLVPGGARDASANWIGIPGGAGTTSRDDDDDPFPVLTTPPWCARVYTYVYSSSSHLAHLSSKLSRRTTALNSRATRKKYLENKSNLAMFDN